MINRNFKTKGMKYFSYSILILLCISYPAKNTAADAIFFTDELNPVLLSNKEELVDTTKIVPIDRTNYYDHYKIITTHYVTTTFLSMEQVKSVVMDELIKLNYKFEIDKAYELESTERITLDFYLEDQKLGILFPSSNNYGSVKKEHKNINTDIEKPYMLERNLSNGGLYRDILVLQKTWYWYQYTEENIDVELCGKSDIEEILRQDLRFFIKEYLNSSTK